MERGEKVLCELGMERRPNIIPASGLTTPTPLPSAKRSTKHHWIWALSLTARSRTKLSGTERSSTVRVRLNLRGVVRNLNKTKRQHRRESTDSNTERARTESEDPERIGPAILIPVPQVRTGKQGTYYHARVFVVKLMYTASIQTI